MPRNQTIKPVPNFSVGSKNRRPEKASLARDAGNVHVEMDIDRINAELANFKNPRFKSITGICKDGDVPTLWRIELEEIDDSSE